MEAILVDQPLKNIHGEVLIVGATRGRKDHEQPSVTLLPAAREVDQLLDGFLTGIGASGEFQGNAGETVQIYTMDRLPVRRIILVGLGTNDTIQAHTFRRASGMAVRFAQSKGAHEVFLALDGRETNLDEALVLQAVVEGALLGTYSFTHYQTLRRKETQLATIQFLHPQAGQEALAEAFKRGRVMAEATNFARELVNEPPAVLTPTEMAERARLMAGQTGLTCEILERPQMVELGMGGLLAVAKGSAEPPKLIILRYRGAPQTQDGGIALIGKGITFDSGGLSLKPAANMDAMKGDMAGGAAVLGAMQIIATLKPALNVTALVPASENMPDGAAFRPGDILRLMNGKTIEIVNTDAEGRLALADALSYAVREGYTTLIDIATLTGSCMNALGAKRAGLFCNDAALQAALLAASEETGERLWPMPLSEEYAELIESQVADIKQSGGRLGGAITAAKVLEHFVGTTHWAHLDIAGLELSEARSSFMGAGATGFGTRMLATFVLKRASTQKQERTNHLQER